MDSRRNKVLLSIAVISFGIAIWVYPVSTVLTKAAALAVAFSGWSILLWIVWKRRWVRIACFAVPGLAAAFLALPSSAGHSVDALRSGYVDRLQAFSGVRYYWGGESSRGIDCSGLVRCGLIDALWRQGIRTGNPGLVRAALKLWWYDCSARDLGAGASEGGDLTARVLEVKSIDELDHTKIMPGDLAVTSSGVHVLAYIGAQQWIEADTEQMRVITVTAPSKENIWFQTPVKIVRWRLLQ